MLQVLSIQLYIWKTKIKEKKETQQYKKIKIRLSKVTNTQKKVVKEKKNIKKRDKQQKLQEEKEIVFANIVENENHQWNKKIWNQPFQQAQ